MSEHKGDELSATGSHRVWTGDTAGSHVRAGAPRDPQRNWLDLWKPTIDALDPLLGRTHPDRDWHPRDGRIVDLGLHLDVDPSLGNDVVISIAATSASG